MKPYRKYPPDPPQMKHWRWLIYALVGANLVVNVAIIVTKKFGGIFF